MHRRMRFVDKRKSKAIIFYRDFLLPIIPMSLCTARGQLAFQHGIANKFKHIAQPENADDFT